MTKPKTTHDHRPSVVELFEIDQVLIGLVLIGLVLVLLPSSVRAQETMPTPTATRYISIFDAMQTPATETPFPAEAQAGATQTPAPQVTRYQSIFDTTPQNGVTQLPPVADDQPTRVPSLFDTLPSTPAATQELTTDDGAAQPTPYGSIFDEAPSSVIQYEGEEEPDREYCLSCHAMDFVQMDLPSGEIISVNVDEDSYLASVHGQHGIDGYRCIRCHVGMNEYPHEEITADTARALTLDYSTTCERCHPAQYDETLDDLHMIALTSGNEEAAVCSDCHGAHDIAALSDLETGERLPTADQASVAMCASCHTEVYDRYVGSIHGAALLEGSQDVPTCADCHGIHDTTGPSDPSFRLFSPQTCAECHADEELMAQYGISTAVFDTYVADFHGTTVTIFQNTAPDQPFNAPVCVDCHGIHTIAALDETGDRAMLKENLVVACQRCHPGATANFPDAWMSHYPPSFNRTPLVAIASAAYTLAIPTIVGVLGIFVVSDVRRRRRSHNEERTE